MDFAVILDELQGTEAGAFVALALALLSALAHATFGAINKSAQPVYTRGMINTIYGITAAPFALYIMPWPDDALWPILALMFVVHVFYEWFQSRSFESGAFVVVYPIGRGTGPLLIAIWASLLFAEPLSAQQWLGICLISGGIMSIAFANLGDVKAQSLERGELRMAILFSLLTGLFISLYTMVDAYGIRLAENPLTFLSWFFFSGLFGSPLIALARWRKRRDLVEFYPLFVRGVFGAMVAVISFGGVMLAMRLGNVAAVAAIRETSVIFGTAIGVLLFKEHITPFRLGMVFIIFLGAVLIEI